MYPMNNTNTNTLTLETYLNGDGAEQVQKLINWFVAAKTALGYAAAAAYDAIVEGFAVVAQCPPTEGCKFTSAVIHAASQRLSQFSDFYASAVNVPAVQKYYSRKLAAGATAEQLGITDKGAATAELAGVTATASGDALLGGGDDGGEGVTLWDLSADDSATDAAELAVRNDDVRIARERVARLLAGLNEREREVVTGLLAYIQDNGAERGFAAEFAAKLVASGRSASLNSAKVTVSNTLAKIAKLKF